jgi:hypothetical protein
MRDPPPCPVRSSRSAPANQARRRRTEAWRAGNSADAMRRPARQNTHRDSGQK